MQTVIARIHIGDWKIREGQRAENRVGEKVAVWEGVCLGFGLLRSLSRTFRWDSSVVDTTTAKQHLPKRIRGAISCPPVSSLVPHVLLSALPLCLPLSLFLFLSISLFVSQSHTYML